MSADTQNSNKECPLCGPDCPYREEVFALREKVNTLQTLARTDALTGLFNYRHFTETLSNEMERVRRSGQPLALIIGDVDHFKRFNDTYGHELGNEVLRRVGRCIERNLRKLDIACRYGGEEFALILPGTNARQAERVAERIRQAVASEAIHTEIGDVARIRMSLGGAVYTSDSRATPEAFIAAADAQLYLAKEGGRDCVRIEQPARPASSPVTQEEKSALFALLNSNQSEENEKE